jgi:hypothetical protein
VFQFGIIETVNIYKYGGILEVFLFPAVKQVTVCIATINLELGKGKAIPLQAWRSPGGSRSSRPPRFQDNQHMKVVRLSVLPTGRLYPPENIPVTHFR